MIVWRAASGGMFADRAGMKSSYKNDHFNINIPLELSSAAR